MERLEMQLFRSARYFLQNRHDRQLDFHGLADEIGLHLYRTCEHKSFVAADTEAVCSGCGLWDSERSRFRYKVAAEKEYRVSPQDEFLNDAIALVEKWADAVNDQLGQQGLVVYAFDIKAALHELRAKHSKPQPYVHTKNWPT